MLVPVIQRGLPPPLHLSRPPGRSSVEKQPSLQKEPFFMQWSSLNQHNNIIICLSEFLARWVPIKDAAQTSGGSVTRLRHCTGGARDGGAAAGGDVRAQEYIPVSPHLHHAISTRATTGRAAAPVRRHIANLHVYFLHKII